MADEKPAGSGAGEPLGPLTPDDQTPLGDTPEAHDEISPHDLPPGHPGRKEAERRAAAGAGGTPPGGAGAPPPRPPGRPGAEEAEARAAEGADGTTSGDA